VQIAKSVNALVGPIAKSVQSELGAWSSKDKTTFFQSVRRLESTMTLDIPELSAACKEACPSAEAMHTDLTSVTSSMGSDAGIKQMLTGVFDLMCKHPDALQCMETNQAVCDPDAGGAPDVGGAPDITAMGECFCTHCPGLKDAYITFFDGFMTQMQSQMEGGGQSSAPADPTAMMRMVCPLIGGLKCAVPQPSCASVTSGIPGIGSDINTAEAGCKAMGISTDPGGVADASSTTAVKLSMIATVAAGFRFAF